LPITLHPLREVVVVTVEEAKEDLAVAERRTMRSQLTAAVVRNAI
jgi:hypothetical protein